MSGTKVSKNVYPEERLQDCLSALRDRALTAAGLTIGSSSKLKVKIANTVTYVYDGLFKSKTTAEVDFTATTDDIIADSATVQERVYLMVLAADGTPSLVAGEQATGAGNAVVPVTPDNKVAIGYLRLAVAAGSTNFDATTDELDEAHLTDTYVDLSINPRDYEYENETH